MVSLRPGHGARLVSKRTKSLNIFLGGKVLVTGYRTEALALLSRQWAAEL